MPVWDISDSKSRKLFVELFLSDGSMRKIHLGTFNRNTAGVAALQVDALHRAFNDLSPNFPGRLCSQVSAEL